MIRKSADEQFENLFEATFDDAVAYVAGTTGTFDIVEKITTAMAISIAM